MDAVLQDATAPMTTMDPESLKDAGYALCAVGQLLANTYRFPLTDEQVEFFRELSGDGDDFILQNDACKEGVRTIREYFSVEDLAPAKQDAKNDFHKLFVGPDKLRAVPWSSDYVDAQGIFGPTSQKVQAVFRDHGFEIPEGRREPSDHIAYELQFLVELQREALDVWEGSGAEVPEQTKVLLGEAAAFKKQLMDIWVPRFLQKVNDGARVPMYKGIADLTKGYLELEEQFLVLPELSLNDSSKEVRSDG